MVQGKRKTKLLCLGCYNGRNAFSNPRRPKQYDAYAYLNGAIKSPSLSTHLQKHQKCDDYYRHVVENKLHELGLDSFFTSRVELLPPSRARKARYKPDELGLTMAYNHPGQTTACYVVPSTASAPQNSKVMYDGTVEHLDREEIEAGLFLDDEDDVDDGPIENLIAFSETDPMEEESSVDTLPGTTLFSIATPSLENNILSDQLTTEIKLLSLMRIYKTPLCVQKAIFDWAYEAHSLPSFSWGARINPYRSRQRVMKDIKTNALPHLKDDGYETKSIPWLPDRTLKQITTRSFEKAIRSLITNKDLCKQENMSFPNVDSPLLSHRKPELTPETRIEELHHGSWWIDTWKEKCDPGRNEILVPLIFYMDGISVDTHGKLSLTPLQMSLGIFSTEARKRRDAWETIYFHPSCSDAKEPKDNIQNLHNGIEAALEQLKNMWRCNNTIEWQNLPWANRTWEVQMKFSIAFFIGDTEMHDKLCGRYGNRTEKVKKLCRHCDCPINWTHIPSKNDRNVRKLFLPEDIRASTNTDEALNEISHHPIRNVFHDMDFGCNEHNIHLASPGEKLHMHQLGTAKRALASFLERFNPAKKGALKDAMENLAKRYGSQLARQSDRNFPRTKFSSGYLTTVKKEGSDYAGLILCLLLALLSSKGDSVMVKGRKKVCPDTVKNFVLALEQVLGMEEFMKSGSIKLKHIEIMPRIVAHFLHELNINCYRTEGMGDRLIKKHLWFHLKDYIERWGSPDGWNSAPSESHHKSEIKAPSKSTQCNKSTFVDQTAGRQLEYRMIDRCMTGYSLHPVVDSREKKDVAGAKYKIGISDDNRAYMQWERPEFRGRPGPPQEVMNFVCHHVLPIMSDYSQVKCFTEHNRKNTGDGEQFIFRASPSYRSESGQRNAIWYDWAYCVFAKEEDGEEVEVLIPCQLLCFLQLEGVQPKANGEPIFVNTYEIPGDGAYVVVRKFADEPKPHPYSKVVRTGTMESDLCLMHVDMIEKPVSVVENIGEEGSFFVVGNRSEWLSSFVERAESLRGLHYSREELYPTKYPNPYPPKPLPKPTTDADDD